MPQINEERLTIALVSQGVSLPDAQVIAAEAATAAAAVISPAPAPAAAPAPTTTAPLTKAERKEVFVEQRAAELEAAGKPVDTKALEKRFDELAKTTDGRAQITTIVQRAEPEILQAIVPDKVSIPEPAPAPAPTPTAETVTQQPPARTPAQNAVVPENVRPEELAKGLFTQEAPTPGVSSVGPTAQPVTPQEVPAPVPVEQPPAQNAVAPENVRPEELARGLFGGTPTPGTTSVGPTPQPTVPVGGPGGPVGGPGGPVGGPGGATGGNDNTETPEERRTRLANEREDAREEAARISRGRDARTTMAAVLNTYGLGELTEYVYGLIAREEVNLNNPDAIIFALREQPAYQRRFAGNAARLRAGLSELSPADYIGLENQFRQTLQSNLGPEMLSVYGTQETFQELIEGDVSPSELNERVQQGYRAVADADPGVKEQMRTLYGVTEGQLVGYFLDPTKAAPLLTRRAQAAQIAARGLEQGGMQLTGQFAENLARRGITEQQARAGFAEVGGLGELKQTLAGETALSDEQLAGAAFGIDVASQQELERKRRRRTAEFAGGGSFARTTGETSGSISTSVGKAQ